MIDLLSSCDAQVEFASHHAEWLRKRGLPDLEYLPTPIPDPLNGGTRTADIVAHNRKEKPRILMIGDLTGIATRLGMELFAKDILPKLENRFGHNGFEIRVVGGGTLPSHVAERLDRPSVNMIGKIVPPDPEFLTSDIVLVPTPVEIGMRVRIAVAFGYGCCVVAHEANSAGIPEMEHGVNALLGKSGAELAEMVILAISDPQLRSKLSRNTRETFKTYFSANIAARRVEKKLASIASQR